jgi:hypothetical protein
VIASATHPDLRSRLTLDQYLAARHVVVTPWNEPRGVVDYVLDRLGLARQVAMQLPSVLAAPFVIAGSTLLMTVPNRAAQVLQRGADPHLRRAVRHPRYTVKIYSHAKHARTDAHRWLTRAAPGKPPPRAPPTAVRGRVDTTSKRRQLITNYLPILPSCRLRRHPLRRQ